MAVKKLKCKKGDHFKGHNFQIVDEMGSPVNLTGASLHLWFRRGHKKGPIPTGGQMTIGEGLAWINQAAGTVRLLKQVIDWEADTYYADGQFRFPDSDLTIETIIDITMEVEQDVTQPTYP